MKKMSFGFFLLGAVILLHGCCSIMHGNSQKVVINSNPAGAVVKVNGTVRGSTPTIVVLERKSHPSITVEKQGYHTYSTYLTRSVDPWLAGSLLLYVVPAVVDLANGSAFELQPKAIYANLEKDGDSSSPAAGRQDSEIPAERQIRIDSMKSPAEQLRELKRLRDEGVISEEQYQRLRKPLVDQL